MSDGRKPLTYRDSGVDIDRQDQALVHIKRLVSETRTPGALSEVGNFGGLFRLRDDPASPILVSSCDGVGTKLRVAFEAGVHDSVGRDLVNHCVNDILVQGAEPLFFLDYVASGRLDPAVLTDVVGGLARGCKEAGCALLGGELAEMPGFYRDGEYDVAGFVVGAVAPERLIDGSKIRPGHRLVGLPSAGLHTNGFSLARKILFDVMGLAVGDAVPGLGVSAAEALLAEHRSYLGPLRDLVRRGEIDGLAHITGGGIPDNLPRILPDGVAARVVPGSWPVPRLFELLASEGRVADAEMARTFNMGVGMVLVVDPARLAEVTSHLDAVGETWHAIGEVVPGERNVIRG